MSNSDELSLAKEVAKKAKELAKEREAKLLATVRAEFYSQFAEVLKAGIVEASTWHVGEGVPALTVGKASDFFLDATTGDIFFNNGGIWGQVLNIKGSDGKDGEDGRDGLRGIVGLTGEKGKDGRNGKDGKDGRNGRDGFDGAKGKDGKNGKDGNATKWFSNRGTPSYSVGKVGDFYLDNSTGKYYEKTTSLKWELQGSLRGPSGVSGLRGEAGEAGEGVASGGTAGQVLAKINGDDFATEWVDMVGGVPDEEYGYIDLTGKIRGTPPAASMTPPAIAESYGGIYWTRVGRTIKCKFAYSIPYTSDWGDVDAFFGIHAPIILAEDLPYIPRVYPNIGSSPFTNMGHFGLINSNSSDGTTYTYGSSTGSAITDFGGGLQQPALVNFVTGETVGGIQTLLFEGNPANLVGYEVAIFGSIDYEAAEGL